MFSTVFLANCRKFGWIERVQLIYFAYSIKINVSGKMSVFKCQMLKFCKYVSLYLIMLKFIL